MMSTPPLVHGERPVMYAKSIQGGAIKTLFEVLKEIVHDVCLQFDETGIRLLTVDGHRCSLVNVKLRAESFEEYYCHGKQTAGVNLACLFKVLRFMGSHDTFTFYMLPSTCDRLGIIANNAEKNSVTDSQLNLLDVNTEDIAIPDVEFDSVITMPSVTLQKFCSVANGMANELTITSHNETLTLFCQGDFARQETVFGKRSDMVFTCNPDVPKVSGTFNLQRLQHFCKAASISSTVELYLKNAIPLIMRYNVASLGEVKFVLAPQAEQ